MAELCHLAQHCNYGDMLDKLLRDRIIWKDLTYEKAVWVAQGFETADKDLKEQRRGTGQNGASTQGVEKECKRQHY